MLKVKVIILFDKKFDKQAEKITKNFTDFMEEKGFTVLIHNDKDLGDGAIALNKYDKFTPIFNLSNYRYPKSFSIRVEDRN